MIPLSQMVIRFAVALALGSLMGLERELVGKDAGIKTAMTVSAGAAIFTLVGLNLPFMASPDEEVAGYLIRNGNYFGMLANIVIGIGFLGAGIIIKTEERIHGLTTAAVIWATAGIGILAGLGLFRFAAIATGILSGLLYALRTVTVAVRASK